MTGYGKKTAQLPGKKLTIEIKSLNSKSLDLNMRLPSMYREKELEIRNLLATTLVRGKIDCLIYTEITGPEEAAVINTALVDSYVTQLKEISQKHHLEADILATVMRLPDTLRTEKNELNEAEWNTVKNVLHESLQSVLDFRKQEGDVLVKEYTERIANIQNLLDQVPQYEAERIETVKARITKNLESLSTNYDENRFEQELIFYMEKLDVTEEKVRLQNHLDYFLQSMESEEASGRKLNFISQEMGREINTLGSKANHSQLQKIVVQMKDELEKIKEQTGNTL